MNIKDEAVEAAVAAAVQANINTKITYRAMEVALTAALPHMGDEALAHDAIFLIERLDEFERGSLGDTIEDAYRDFAGHVSPAIGRLRAALSAKEGQ